MVRRFILDHCVTTLLIGCVIAIIIGYFVGDQPPYRSAHTTANSIADSATNDSAANESLGISLSLSADGTLTATVDESRWKALTNDSRQSILLAMRTSYEPFFRSDHSKGTMRVRVIGRDGSGLDGDI